MPIRLYRIYRVFRCSFNRKPLKYSNTAICYLVIADQGGLQSCRMS